jgi:hypothetical protein
MLHSARDRILFAHLRRPMVEQRPPSDGEGLVRRQRKRPEQPAVYDAVVDIGPSAQARIRETVAGVRRGDPAVLRSLHTARFGTTPSDLEPGCKGYLTPDRLSWFGLWPEAVPRTGPLRGPEALDVAVTEFCSPLATVVGSDLHDVSLIFPGTKIPWDTGIPDGASPNAAVGLGFSVRGGLPTATTILQRLPVNLGGELGITQEVVLINDQGGVQEADPLLVSLFLDFVVPQRAVALEYGFFGAREESIDPTQVELLAFGDDGRLIVNSTGTDLHGPEPIPALTVFNVIGVRDQGGAISTVELRFNLAVDPRTQPRPGFHPHLVRRIWHEALAPAAVTQGTVAMEVYPNPPKPGEHRIAPAPLSDKEKAPATVSLPFRCNRAVVLMRGFKVEYLDEEPHPINVIEAGIAAPAVFEVERRGSITFSATGLLTPAPQDVPGVVVKGEPPPFRVFVNFTVLAWDSDQMELIPRAAEARDPVPRGQNAPSALRMTAPDPCPLQPGSDPSTRCGALFGGVQKFRYRLDPSPYGPFSQNVDKIGWAAGQMGGGPCELGETSSTAWLLGMVAPVRFSAPDLARAQGSINWDFCTLLGGGDGLYLRDVKGVLLAGRGVSLNTDSVGFGVALPKVGPRRQPTDFIATFDGQLAWPVEGDMAVTGLGLAYCEANGPLRELEFEVSAKEYDGHFLSWQLGGGVLTLPPISNEDPERLLFAVPTVTAVRRKHVVADTHLMVQDLLFDNAVVGLVAQVPTQLGVLRNEGNIPINVADATPGGPHMDEYAVWLHYRSDVFSAYQASSHQPIRLDPGESLVLTGWFVPQAAAPPDQEARTAWVEFLTSSSQSPRARVMIRGHTADNQATGVLVPEQVNFGEVEVTPAGAGLPVAALRNIVIESAGQTPLFMSFALENETLGFRIRGWDGGDAQVQVNGVQGWQLNPGHAMLVHMEFVPNREGPVHTRLMVTSNDSDPTHHPLTARLNGAGRA